ncbi:hypothetical protein NP233_g6020 [Leucocoprinus birnbaumii]|uniref:Helitron helicase-like domain-containing protein n=1 Tax=Leucocoprinus birnbaumii TaxID=56174 RepID=A0AAD5YRC2_9AGAR|nr:hypothetical protein NP233_g6020 [Leucocoprinus birnbaumii]
MIKVRRSRVRDALVWLKRYNPLYRDVIISEERLEQLPIEGIPEEIRSTAKYLTDLDMVMKEHESYVPDQQIDEATPDNADPESHPTYGINDVVECESESDSDSGSIDAQGEVYGPYFHKGATEHECTDTGTVVVPLQAQGVVDVTGRSITDSEILAHAFANTALNRPGNQNLLIKRGSAFINEYVRYDPVTGEHNDGGPSNPNHLLGCFPWLFPFGCGGFEVDRQINVPYETHTRWALLYSDKQFRLDHQFIFQVFGVMQKRAVCRAASLHITRPFFQRNQNAIAHLTERDFLQASEEEIANRPISNPIMRSLREEVSTVQVQIAGTDESCIGIRRKIWGATAMFGPPSIWLTINPSDIHDPIAQVLAGEDINLNEFNPHVGPTTSQRALNIAKDPLAAAEFFHRVVMAMLEDVFGIAGAKGVSHVKRRKGILGTIQGYVGTVEAQCRGTLHLHCVIWLEGAPSTSEMAAVLQEPAFCERVREFIRAHISADVGDMNAEEFLQLPRRPDISYSRPLDPSNPDFEIQCKERERLLARSVQVHKCSPNTCLRTINGRLMCKRRAPFELSSREWITPDGRWGPKRTCGYVNNYN